MTTIGGKYRNDMTWNTQVDSVDINVLWSKQSFGGNWQWSTTNVRVAVADTCSSTSAPVSGCTDPTATNYDPTATVDDGSCVYPPSPALTITATVCDTASSVRLTGPWWDGISWRPFATSSLKWNMDVCSPSTYCRYGILVSS